MRTIRIELGGGPLVADIYEDAPPGAAAVLLIHGWGGSGRYWRAAIERLRGRYRLVVPDLPGVGRALPVRRAFDIAAHADGAAALLDGLQWGPAHVVGHSMGGGIAMLLAAHRPELVNRLVLTAISLFRNDFERAFFIQITKAAGALMRLRADWMADLPLLARQFARRFFYELPADSAILRDGFLDYLRMDHATALASARSAASPAIPAAARRIQAPTLLIAARQDRIMPAANVPYTLDTIKGSQVRWIEHCGHLPMVERPDEYAAVVSDFLSETSRDALAERTFTA